MNKSLALKNKLYLFFLLITSFFIFVYLFYFLINGDRGLISYFKIKNQHSELTVSLIEYKEKNDILANKIKMLQPNTIDLDFLDEKVRQKTGYIDKNELLVKFD